MKINQTKKRVPITVPGFLFAGVGAGIKDDPRKKDVALIYSAAPQTTVAGLFTRNRISAAPVRICKAHLKKKTARLIVTNSGIANAVTGNKGMAAAQSVVREAAALFGLKAHEVFVCSTGKIGVELPIAKVWRGMFLGKDRLHPGGFYRAAEAICTTDAYQKTVFYKGRLGRKDFHIAVMAKGAGMISPNMATMLCFVVTDLNIPQPVLQTLLKNGVDDTLNALSVDGDTSTNDTVLMMANGLAGNSAMRLNSPACHHVQKILSDLLGQIALKIALDGEGATKCFIVHVSGAKSGADAKLAARAIANSPLVKTAMFGSDPNWGRVICAVGYSGARIEEERLTIAFGGKPLFERGRIHAKNITHASKYLRQNKVVDVHVELGLGQGSARVLASDLTYDYVRLNAEYHT